MKYILSFVLLFTFLYPNTSQAAQETPDVRVTSSSVQCSFVGPLSPDDYFSCVYFPRFENFVWSDDYSEITDSFYPLQNSYPPTSLYYGPFYEITVDSGCSGPPDGDFVCHNESYNDIYIKPNTTLSHVIIAYVQDDPDYSNNLLVDTFKVLEDGSVIQGYSENNFYNNFYNNGYNNNFNNGYLAPFDIVSNGYNNGYNNNYNNGYNNDYNNGYIAPY